MKTLLIPFLLGMLATSSAIAAEKPLTRDEVKKIVEEVIMEKPELLIESLQAMQQKEAMKAAAQSAEALTKRHADIYENPSSPVIGNPKGDVTIVEFFDYNCGYCKKIYPAIAQLVAEDKNLRVVMKEYPILSETSELASRAALAVHNIAPEKYFAFHGALMEHNGAIDAALINNTATGLGIKVDALKKAMEDPALLQVMKDDRELGTALAVRGTPAIIIGEELVPGAIPIEQIKEKIAAVRAAKKS